MKTGDFVITAAPGNIFRISEVVNVTEKRARLNHVSIFDPGPVTITHLGHFTHVVTGFVDPYIKLDSLPPSPVTFPDAEAAVNTLRAVLAMHAERHELMTLVAAADKSIEAWVVNHVNSLKIR